MEKEKSLFELIQAWLERMPFSDFQEWNFWEVYEEKVSLMLKEDENIINSKSQLGDEIKRIELANLAQTKKNFDSLMDAAAYNQLKTGKIVKLSQKALLNALFIELYRDWPVMSLPHQLVQLLIEVDEYFTTWRYRHALMVQRILGTKIGTGGSSGHDYLKKTTESNRVFNDLFHLSSFLIPKHHIPELPSDLKQSLSFNYDSKL